MLKSKFNFDSYHPNIIPTLLFYTQFTLYLNFVTTAMYMKIKSAFTNFIHHVFRCLVYYLLGNSIPLQFNSGRRRVSNWVETFVFAMYVHQGH